jgi:hypothetical protein
MTLLNYYAIVEDALRVVGIQPEEARCAKEGEWQLQKGESEIYIDLWVPESVNQWQYYVAENPEPLLQIMIPIGSLQAITNRELLMADLLQLNAQLYYGAFIFNPEQNMVALQFKRLATGINQREVLEPINALGYYAENLSIMLKDRFQLKLA